MKFEWDETKNQANIAKHGIDFDTASEAFSDPNAVRRFDRVVGTEKRFHLVGKVRGILIVLVAFTERNGNTRIISARPAGRDKVIYNG
ncbi:MAG TPA: BrnT family toxin [Burkholderiales bacterium]|nr:BrnT family toxin [Burkholderiales bacterium]